MAFKPGTDDIRESPALPVTQKLLDERAIVTCFDPIAHHEAEKIFGDKVLFREDLSAAIANVDAILIMTRWQHFDALPAMLKDLPNPPLVIDGRRMLEKTALHRYEGIGLKGT
jgi:UDPglucose 6-dehydrogenase